MKRLPLVVALLEESTLHMASDCLMLSSGDVGIRLPGENASVDIPYIPSCCSLRTRGGERWAALHGGFFRSSFLHTLFR